MSGSEERLAQLLEQLAAAGVKKGSSSLEAAAVEAGNYFAGSEVRDELGDQILEGIGKVKAAAPRLGEVAATELASLLASGFHATAAGFPEGIRDLAYQARREMFRAITVEETRQARLRAERLQFLAELLEDLGAIAIKVLPLLIAAL